MNSSVGVVIPTYQRPDWLRGAVRSLVEQSVSPARVAVVARDTDTPTHDRARELIESSPWPVELLTVSEPGHVPPVARGTEHLARKVDLVAVLDDDATARPEWCARFCEAFSARPDVGAVGGRVVNRAMDGSMHDEGRADVFGRWDWLGRPTGNMYRDGGESPRPADFFMGGNVCFRASALDDVAFDLVLNRDVAFHYELDVALQIKRAGWEIVYDPQNAIDHYSAPRANDGLRTNNMDSLRASSRNLTRIRLKHMRGVSRAAALAWGAQIGTRREPGWLSSVGLCLQERSSAPLARFGASLHGRLQAYWEYLEDRGGPS